VSNVPLGVDPQRWGLLSALVGVLHELLRVYRSNPRVAGTVLVEQRAIFRRWAGLQAEGQPMTRASSRTFLTLGDWRRKRAISRVLESQKLHDFAEVSDPHNTAAWPVDP